MSASSLTFAILPACWLKLSLPPPPLQKGNLKLQMTFCSLLGKDHCSTVCFTLPNYLIALEAPVLIWVLEDKTGKA